MLEPMFEIAHLGHVELLTPVLEKSVWFFRDVLGMEVVDEDNVSVYMRCWGDYERYSLKVTQSPQPGVGHTALRTMSPEALDRRVEALQARGVDGKWVEGDHGHGPAYQFFGPDGHLMELYYETTYYQPPAELRPTLKNQPQKFTGRGASVKTLDHVNYLSSNPEADGQMVEDVLGLRLTEQIVLDNGRHAGLWYRVANKSYDLVYTHDETGAKGRLHHIAFRVDSNESIWRAADLFVDHDIYIEFAPSKHAINQTHFVYVYEPGGNRIEVCSGGYLVLAPDWQPITWTETERKRGQAWGNPTVASFHRYGTPVVEGV